LLHLLLLLQAQELKHQAHKGVTQITAIGSGAAASVARFFKLGSGKKGKTAQQDNNSNGATAAAAAKDGSPETTFTAALRHPSVFEQTVEQTVDDLTDKLKDVNMVRHDGRLQLEWRRHLLSAAAGGNSCSWNEGWQCSGCSAADITDGF
jgi:hypothetical protein